MSSRHRELCSFAQTCGEPQSHLKPVSAGHRNQHSRRVCYPRDPYHIMSTSTVTAPSKTTARNGAKSPCPIFINGEWREITGVGTTPVYNPSRGEVIAEVPLCGADIVDEA